MSNGQSNNTFENLTHSGIFKVNSKDDKTVSLSLNVFNGRTQLAVFSGGGGRPWSKSLGRAQISLIKKILRIMISKAAPNYREPIMLNDWDPETKKTKQTGSIGFGFDETMTFVIDVAADDLPGRKHTFHVRPPFGFDVSNTSLTEKDVAVATVETFIEALSLESVVREAISSFKRQPGGNGGGNRQGGGNRGGYNNNNGGNRNNGGTFSGSNDVTEDDLYV